MKKVKFILIASLLLLSLTKCKKSDNVIYDVLDNKQYGAALRTLDLQSNVFNMFDQESEFSVVVEEQDEQYGDLLEKMNVYVSFIDKTDDGVDNNRAEELLISVPASEFTESSKGLPMTNFSTTFENTLNALNLNDGEYFGGDTFKFRFEIVLSDGRTFSEESSSSTLQQSFFNSPFSYYVNIVCIPVTPIPGDYKLAMHDAYGDGWQGSKIIVTIDGETTEYALPNYWTAGLGGSVGDPMYTDAVETVTVPEGSYELKWEFVAGDWPSEVSFEIYGPNSGDIIYADGPNPQEGELFLNYCNE